ncbi:MAG: Mur ligase family protein, partial [Patescibacteria group bacterium]|nr:Mur ligase family protein [Patescibacteria group bacterium]
MIASSLSIYSPKYPLVLAYMLQCTEYQALPYLRWIWRTEDFGSVRQRRQLDNTRAAKLLAALLYAGMLCEILLGVALIYLGTQGDLIGGVPYGLTLILIYPVLWAHLVVFPLLTARYLIINPSVKRAIRSTTPIYADHPGVKIAVAGSYGKTTMKELLTTVLSEKLVVAATPANKNVSSSHAAFAKTLAGTEDVLILEYGEGEPGDIARFTAHTTPTHAIITGLAPAHLDKYKTLQAAGEDIFSVTKSIISEHVYVNTDSPELQSFVKPNYQKFSNSGALGWKVSKVEIGLHGTSFIMKKAKQALTLQSGLVGEHQVGFLAFVAALAIELGLSLKQVEAGITKTQPFEHRMQPYLLNGAWIVDDTYNGNLEGIRAGTNLLKN